MPRGGRRQGQPGVAYGNRTDLLVDRNNTGSAASGGYVAPTQSAPAAPQPPVAYPEDTPGLLDPSTRPNEPVTTGLQYGAGAGPEALAQDPRVQEAQALKPWLPILEPIANRPDTPESVRTLVRYIRGS